jgi:NAD(P)-dependent dehydrogenase (short-subunit alcohol dehydrogenase family)
MTTSSSVALVTGRSAGLGLALVRGLAGRGWSVITDARGADALGRAYAGTDVIAIAGDVTDPAHQRALAVLARGHTGVDAVISNAGTLGEVPLPRLLDYSLDELVEVYVTNVVAPVAVLQAVRHEFKPGARIINVTSDAAVNAYPGWGGYGSSKAALEQLSAVLAVELAVDRPDIRVYAVDPGDMRTDMHQAAFPGEDIGDRPLPEARVPGFVALLEGDLPSGRYEAAKLAAERAAEAVGV